LSANLFLVQNLHSTVNLSTPALFCSAQSSDRVQPRALNWSLQYIDVFAHSHRTVSRDNIVEGPQLTAHPIDPFSSQSLGQPSSVWRNPLPQPHLQFPSSRVTSFSQHYTTQLHPPSQSANMSNDVSPDQMQTRIQQARREAENLKDRIKRKKDELADGTRK
jgi:hypothetical protein